MSIAQATPQTAALAGVVVIARIRRVLILAVVAALAYSVVMNGSSGYCPGGFDNNGGFIDSSGQATDQAPMCVGMQLRPSILVYIGIGLIVLLAIGRVMKASDELAALRILDRATIAIGVLGVIAAVVSVVWFRMIPIQDFTGGSWTVFSPFPFGVITVEITPNDF